MSFMPHPLLASGQTATTSCFMSSANKEKMVGGRKAQDVIVRMSNRDLFLYLEQWNGRK